MLRLARPTPAARAGALLALGALAVHEVRYLLAYGSQAHQAMASQGHGYLGELTPALVVLAASLIAGRLLAAWAGRGADAPAHAPARWPGFAVALVAIFSVQELAEGMAFAGHASGLAAILSRGGWIALAVAPAIGWVCARADRLLAGTERRLRRRARRRGRRRLPRPAASAGAPQDPLDLLRLRPLALGLARRPPPTRAFAP